MIFFCLSQKRQYFIPFNSRHRHCQKYNNIIAGLQNLLKNRKLSELQFDQEKTILRENLDQCDLNMT